jgi:hypothetical protein
MQTLSSHIRTKTAALGVAILLGVCAGTSSGSAETLESSVLGVTRPAVSAGSFEVPGAALSFRASAHASGTVLAVRRYYPKPPTPPPPTTGSPAPPATAPAPREPLGAMTLRGGVVRLDAAADHDEDGTAGAKFVSNVGPMLRLGVSGDVQWRGTSTVESRTVGTDPGGQPVVSTVVTSESDSWLYPVLAVAELHFPLPALNPYVGVGGGWEFLHARVQDYRSGVIGYANYDGPGYQFFGGANVPLASRVRLNAEVFYNGSTVDRTVYDPYLGVAYEEEIDADGWGLRGGVTIPF